MKLKKYFNYSLLALAATVVFASCDDVDDIIADFDDVIESGGYAAALDLTDAEDSTYNVYISEMPDSTEFHVLVRFASTGDDMNRLYMTQNNNGAGEEAFELEMESLDTKGDGSIDLPAALGEEFTFVLPFDILEGGSGTYEYNLWATSGKGDYRDKDKRFAVGVGTIIVHYEGENPDTAVKEFETTLFEAPLASGKSNSFASTLDGTVFQIVPDGDLSDEELQEYVSFWDFGYYYGSTGLASLASTFDYPSSIVDIVELTGVEESELNNCYFALSDLVYDDITYSIDLDGITASSSERVNQLEEGNVVEFVDNYGKKGVLKVVEIIAGDGSTGEMTISVKVQP